MLKSQKGLFIGILCSMVLLLGGCFKGDESLEEIDQPEDATPVDQLEDIQSVLEDEDEQEDPTGEESYEYVSRQLYLLDANGMVVAQTIDIPRPESKAVASQALEYLVKGGPVTPLLPNGFEAVLPEGTEILGVNIQEDGTAIVDVSKEFENYRAEDEVKILEAITYTLTQFDSIDEIQLRIEGYPLSEMPVDKTPIGEGYSRAKGINVIETDTIDLIDSQVVTMYYPAEYNDNRYYIPVTQHIKYNEKDKYRTIVEALIDGPGFNMNMLHVFNEETILKNHPQLKDGVLELEFNENILKDAEQGVISDEVMETLVRTLTEEQKVKAVQVKVENIDLLKNEQGEEYNEPVTKEAFIKTEKL